MARLTLASTDSANVSRKTVGHHGRVLRNIWLITLLGRMRAGRWPAPTLSWLRRQVADQRPIGANVFASPHAGFNSLMFISRRLRQAKPAQTGLTRRYQPDCCLDIHQGRARVRRISSRNLRESPSHTLLHTFSQAHNTQEIVRGQTSSTFDDWAFMPVDIFC